MRFHEGDLVTVEPAIDDPVILHMQRQVRIERRRDDGYMVRLESVAADNAVHGPIPETRLIPGWVEQNGVQRIDVHGRRVGCAAEGKP